jgi:hypothetical protein
MKKILILLCFTAFAVSANAQRETFTRNSTEMFLPLPKGINTRVAQINGIPAVYKISKGAYEVYGTLVDKMEGDTSTTNLRTGVPRSNENGGSMRYNPAAGVYFIIFNANELNYITSVVNDGKVPVLIGPEKIDQRTNDFLFADYKKMLREEEIGFEVEILARELKLITAADRAGKKTLRKEKKILKQALVFLKEENEAAIEVFENHLNNRRELSSPTYMVNTKDAYFADKPYPETKYGKMVNIPFVDSKNRLIPSEKK